MGIFPTPVVMKTQATLLLLAIAGSSIASSQREVEKELDGLAHQIVYVSTFGQWQQDNQLRGVHRLVMVDARGPYPHSKLYVQWISEAHDGKPDKVVAVKAVDEINRSAVYQLSIPDDANKTLPTNTLQMRGINQYAHTVQAFSVTAVTPGEYRFSYGETSPAGSDNRNVSKQVEQAVRKLPATLEFYARPTF